MQKFNGFYSVKNMTILAGIIATNAGLAQAGMSFERFRFNEIGSFDTIDDPSNVTLTATIIGGFQLGFLDFGGTWTNPNGTGTFGREARLLITPPTTTGLQPLSIQLGSGDEVPEHTMFKRSRLDFSGVDPAGQWTFQFFESFDDVADLADMVWSSVTLDFTDDLITSSLQQMSLRSLTNPSIANGNNGENSPTGARSFLDGPNGFVPYTQNFGFNDHNWSAPENVYAVDWTGGDALFQLSSAFGPMSDLDLFLYSDTGAAMLLGQSSTENNIESIAIQNLPIGRYYLVVDGLRCDQAQYSLIVVPTPGASALTLTAGFLIAPSRRRRRVGASHKNPVIAELKPSALALTH